MPELLPVPGSQSDQDQQYSTELCWKKAFAVNKTVTIRLPEKLFARYQKLIKASNVYSKTRFVKY